MDEANSSASDIQMLETLQKKVFGNQFANKQFDEPYLVNYVSSLVQYRNKDLASIERQRYELVSFLLASSMLNSNSGVSPSDRTSVLRTQSLEARLSILQFYTD